MGDETKFHLVSWHWVCSPIKVGGLGVCNIIKFNQALLGKWMWRFSQEHDTLWRLGIEVKYESVRGGWSSLLVTGSYGVSVWKFIRRGWDNVAKYLRFEVGEGAHIRFWHDLWCGNKPLKLCYLVLYSISRFPNAWVVDNLFVVGGVAHWNVLFTRYAQDWEVEMVISFYELLYFIRIRHREVDRVVWNLSKKMNFEVKTFYKALVCHEAAQFPWKGIWRVKALKLMAFFVWTAVLGKILTHDNLRRRGIVVVKWCIMCKRHGESVDHLLLHCDVARVVWSYFFSLFGVEWVMPSSVLDLLSGCGTLLGHGSAIRIWKQVPLCVLWRERNFRLFEDVEVTIGALCRNVLNMLYLWVSAHSPSRMSFADFLLSCLFISSD
jgi:hypothetical protein